MGGRIDESTGSLAGFHRSFHFGEQLGTDLIQMWSIPFAFFHNAEGSYCVDVALMECFAVSFLTGPAKAKKYTVMEYSINIVSYSSVCIYIYIYTYDML